MELELELLAMQRSQSQTAVYSNEAVGPIIHSAPRVVREVQLMNGFQLRRCALSKTTVLTEACSAVFVNFENRHVI